MCRIYGNIANKAPSPDQTTFERLTLLSKRGGPDHTGYYFDASCQFGFNRLAILDTSERGQQPITSPSGRYILMLNGEVYNFRELAEVHQLKGLRSGSDAEVVAHLLEQLAFESVIKILNGMFAIAVWDTLSQNLFLARDFAGIKPLFYGSNSQGFVFGSHFDQVLRHPWFKGWQWSHTGLREYLQFGFMPAPLTLAADVSQLPPGAWLKYNVKEGLIDLNVYQTYFQTSVTKYHETEPEALNSVHIALKESVERQLVADVPLGVFLSGGIDSCLVAAIASRVRPDVESLTVGFDQKAYDESEKAAEYARLLGIKNQRIVLSDSELLAIFDEHNQALTEPVADYSTFPTYLISRVAASRFKVMLSGDGGDELFWGYPRFRTFARSAPLFNLPGSMLRKVARRTLKAVGYDVTGYLHEQNVGGANLAFHSYLPPQFLDQIWPGSTVSEGLMQEYACNETTRVNILMYLRRNEFYQHLQKILVKVDRMSMANGLEVRVPMLDKAVLECAEAIRPNMLKSHTELKWLLKKVLREYLPEDHIAQKKQGFTPPLKIWSRTNLKSHIADTLASDVSSSLPFEQKGSLLAYGQEYLSGVHDNLEGLWTIYVLLRWKINLDKSISDTCPDK
jgi:asparagine synthase (glutamine-hydrolysing)